MKPLEQTQSLGYLDTHIFPYRAKCQLAKQVALTLGVDFLEWKKPLVIPLFKFFNALLHSSSAFGN
jgi:hypothetical protein